MTTHLTKRVITWIAFFVAATLLATLTTSCDSGGGGGEPPEPPETNDPPTAVASVSASTVEVGVELTFNGSESSDPDGSISTFAWDFDDGSEASGAEVAHTYDAPGDYTATLTVNDSEGATDFDEVTVSVMETAPENVSVTFRPTDEAGSVLEDANVEAGEISGTGEFTEDVPYGTDELTATATLDGFENGTSDFVPDEDQTVEIELAEATSAVTIRTVSLEDGDETLSSELTTSFDSRSESGQSPLEVNVPESVSELSISVDRLELESRAFADTTVTVDVANEITISQRRLPECSDGINNDRDDLVDADDFGCSDGNGGYDPSDDSEVHVTYTSTASIGFRDSTYVSNAGSGGGDGRARNRSVYWNLSQSLPKSAQYGVGEYSVAITAFRDPEETGEDFALGYAVRGDLVNANHFSDIARDTVAHDGRALVPIYGVNKSFFDFEYDVYALKVIHASEIRGEPRGDGGGRVDLGRPASLPGNQRVAYVTSYPYEPEEVPGESTSSVMARARSQPQATTSGQKASGDCFEADGGILCVDGDPDDIYRR